MIKPNDVKNLLQNHIKRTADLVYFYEKISSSDWIDPLRKIGEFHELPDPLSEGNYTSYPLWHPGKYLLRVSQSTTDRSTQNLIADIIMQIPHSKNQHAESLRLQIAAALPPDITVRFIKKLQNQLLGENFIDLRWAETIISSSLHVAKAGHTCSALYLLKSLLRPLPDSRAEQDMPFGIPEAETVIERWYYAKLIEEDLPKFVDVCGPLSVLKILLCPLLEHAVKLNTSNSKSLSDYSLIWRPIIQKSEIHDTYPHQLLTTALVDTAVQAIEKNPQCTSELIELLENREPLRTIFVRIVLHLLTHASEENHELITERLSSPKIISNFELQTEYNDLLRRQFPDLSPEQQNEIVESILSSPQLESEMSYSPMSVDKDKWMLIRLHLILEHLPHEASLHYQALQPNYPDPASLLSEVPPFKIESWTGPTSPLSSDEMGRLCPKDVIAFLKQWTPAWGWNTPSPEGLSRVLANAVTKNATDYVNEADAFRDLEPTYIKTLFYGLTETCQKFPWKPALRLAKWVVDQPRDYDYADQQIADSQAFDRDPDWGWTRKSIAHLLRRGFKPKSNRMQIPYDHQEDVWYICEKLLCDPEPTMEYEQQYGGGRFDYMNMAINTVRGTSMHVVMAFIEWISLNLSKGDDVNNEGGALNMFPRVRRVLESHLSINFDPSLSVRAVYGEWYVRLYQIDKKWASDIIPILFPLEKDKREYFISAWYSYCSSSQVSIELFDLLIDRYKYAIELLKDIYRDSRGSENKMSEHLAELFAMEEEISLVQDTTDKFFEFADDPLRRNMVRLMATNLQICEKDVSELIVRRAKIFWDKRLTMLEETLEQENYPSNHQLELEAYGSWFLLDFLPPDWALEQFLRTLKLAKNTADWSDVCTKLSNLSHDYPQETTECISCLTEQGNEWFLARTDHCRIVLSRIMDSGNEEAKESAKRVINHLVARGFSNYKSIITGTD